MKPQFNTVVLLSLFLVVFSDRRQFRQACPRNSSYDHFSCREFDYGCINENFEDTCENPNQKCCPIDCGYACKDAIYEKGDCPYVGEEGENFFLDYTTTYRLCLSDSSCPEGLLCCRGFCDFPKICHRPEYRKAECPDFPPFPNEENFEDPPKAQRCSTHQDCIDDEKLCCLNGRDTETFCITPYYVLPGKTCSIELLLGSQCFDIPFDQHCLSQGKLCYDTGCGNECVTPPARK